MLIYTIAMAIWVTLGVTALCLLIKIGKESEKIGK